MARHTKRRKPTIHDVAAAAGVSIATVSRVLNNSPLASPAAVAAVTAAIRATDFRPNDVGRQLKTATSRFLGVMVPTIANPVFADAVNGVTREADAQGYATILTSTDYHPEREAASVEALLAYRVAGLILTVADAARSPILRTLDREGVPYVLIFNQPNGGTRPAVTIDNVAAAADAVRHLIGFGHRRIAMVAGSFEASDRSRLRHRGFTRALAAARLPDGAVIEVKFDEVELSDRLAALFKTRTPPTALFCSTDLLAIAAIGCLERLGRRVPDDVSVAGFDGISIGAVMTPRLATIVQPTQAMGEHAVRALLDRINGAKQAPLLCLPHALRAGETVGPAPRQVPVSVIAKSNQNSNQTRRRLP